MERPQIRLEANGRVRASARSASQRLVDQALTPPSLAQLIRGDCVDIAVGIFDEDGEEYSTLANILSVTLEIYAHPGDAETVSTPVTIMGPLPAVTGSQWTAGTHQHALFELEDTHTGFDTTPDIWLVIYATRDDGQRTVFIAGWIRVFESSAGGDPTETPPPPLYPTASQWAAYVAQINGLVTGVVRMRDSVADQAAAEEYDDLAEGDLFLLSDGSLILLRTIAAGPAYTWWSIAAGGGGGGTTITRTGDELRATVQGVTYYWLASTTPLS